MQEEEGEALDLGSLQAADVPLIGGRRFWIYSGLILPRAIRTTFAALEAAFRPDGHDPIGLCVVTANPEEIADRPEAEWADPRLLYAGYVDGRAQVRIGYFTGATIEPPGSGGQGSATPLDGSELPGYRIEPLAERDDVGEQDVLDFWSREQALSPEDARERVGEVVMAATEAGGELVGVSSARLRFNEQLWMDMWHYRVFVGASQRRTHLATALTLATREHLKARYVSGEDTRAGGIVMAIQNPHLRKLDDAVWKATDFAFFGVNAGGDPVRVHYFPGAKAPGPDRIGDDARAPGA